VPVYEPAGSPKAAAVILPGANCAPWRYDRLACALARAGLLVVIADAPERAVPAPGGGERRLLAVGFDDATRAIDTAAHRAPGASLFLIGHSFGGTLALEWFDAAALEANPLYRSLAASPPPTPAGIVALGAHVQASFMGRAIPFHSDDKPLPMPRAMRLLHIAGANDRICPAEQIRRSAARFPVPSLFVSLARANHFSWVDAVGPADALPLDGPAGEDRPRTIARTAASIAAFATAVGDSEALRDAVAAALARGDAVEIAARG
jgi:pimeloyl-ACP methyl ester carboxylesterase